MGHEAMDVTVQVARGRGLWRRAWVALRDDPRWAFSGLLTLYGVLGFSALGFNRTATQMGLIVLTGSVLDALLQRVRQGRWRLPLSGYISSCSLALLLNYAHASWVLLYPVLLTIGSKAVFTFKGRHVFNPSMFGVAVSLLTAREWITSAPAYQWGNNDLWLSLFLVAAAASLFVFRIGRGWLIVSFLVFYTLQTALRAWIMRHHLPPEMLMVGTLTSPPFFIFAFYMLTDPATSPTTPRAQVLVAFLITLVDLVLHTRESVYTVFYAAFTVASGRFLLLHLGELRRVGFRAWCPTLATRSVALKVGALLLMIAAVSTAHTRAWGLYAENVELAFRFEPIPGDESGLDARMGTLLEEVDPRVLHVAKWVLSVGDGVAAGDYDGDGLPDLFLSHPLKSDGDRAALYRNLGDMRFERVELPQLNPLVHDYREEGLASGGAFVDYDGDGDLDLLITVAFGHPRLLQNQLQETGSAHFVEVSREVGLIHHTVSLTATFLDFDRDGRLDLFIPNAMPAFLDGYERPQPFNLFALPQPEHDGDRRMFRFMHDGWHNANNGGENLLYRQTPEGRFELMDAEAMGLTQTRWSLAVGTADLNRDGFTDLYVANDFGPDDVYLNEGGKRFVSVRGRRFGEIGRDTYKGMNVSIADFDRNGWLDVYVSNVHHSLQAEGSLLWMVSASDEGFIPRFRDEATARGALNEHRFGWGAAAGDLDHDGWVDLVQANGMVDDRLDPKGYARKDYWYVNHKLMQSGPEIHTYADMWGDIRGREVYPNEPRRVYLNRGEEKPGHFIDVAARLGVADPDNSRGVLLRDLDGDGDLDLLVTNQHGPTSLYRSDVGQAHPERSAITLTLEGDGARTHRTAIGSRVEVRPLGLPDGAVQIGEATVNVGFSSTAEPQLHFGLGDWTGEVEVVVHWYGAEPERFVRPSGARHHLRQGEAAPAPVRGGGVE